MNRHLIIIYSILVVFFGIRNFHYRLQKKVFKYMYVINIITNTNYNEAAIYIHIMFYHNL